MKVFITGISGFIGSNLARHLTMDGHEVHAVVRSNIPEELKDLKDIQLFSGDLFNKDILYNAMQGCDTAFHLAAFAKPWAKDPNDFYRINVEGTVNVFDAAMKAGVRRVVFTSSAATLSPSTGNNPVNEATPRTHSFFNAYESTKSEAEILAREYCDKGLEVVIVNPSRVYGPGPLNPSNSVTNMIIGYSKGSWRIIPGDGRRIGNYVFIDDVIRGHLLAALKGRPGERYILGGENLSFDELFNTIRYVSSKEYRMFHLPLGVMKVAASFMEWQNKITTIPPAITASWVEKYLHDWSLSSEKAMKELGYTITSFASGVKRTLEWMNARPHGSTDL